MGCAGWGYDDLLPIFKRLEDFPEGDPSIRGRGGPIHCTPLTKFDPLSDAFLRACGEAGYRKLDDYNDGSYEGAFYLQYYRYIDPHIAYGPAISVEALLAAIVGGMGTVFGPLLGAAVLHLLGEATRGLLEEAPGANLVAYGVLLVVVIMFLPRGIMGLFEGKRGKE